MLQHRMYGLLNMAQELMNKIEGKFMEGFGEVFADLEEMDEKKEDV